MLSALALLTIDIGIDPEIHDFGGLLLTWHGVFTAVGIAVGVAVALVLGRRYGYIDDDVYSAALIAIPCGIVGARALFVAERWGTSGVNDVVDIFRINEGGISIYGAVLGGFVGGFVYAWFRKLPLRRALDIAAIALILGMAVGRIGDIINGEHFAKLTDLPWAVRYTHINSPSRLHPECVSIFGIDTQDCTQHPAVAYEMIGDLLIFGLLLGLVRFARPGVAFFSMIFLYSAMRFGVSELRIDSRVVMAGLTVPQVTSLFLIPPSFLGLLYSLRRKESTPQEAAPAKLAAATGPPAS